MEEEKNYLPKETQKEHLPDSVRWRIIGYLESGKTQIEAANYFHCTQSTVSRI